MFEKLQELSKSTKEELIDFITENVVFYDENGILCKRPGVSDEMVEEASNALEKLVDHYQECIKGTKKLEMKFREQKELRISLSERAKKFEERVGPIFSEDPLLKAVFGL